MNFIKQIKEVSLSVLPIAIISAILSILTGSATIIELVEFLFSCVAVIVGLSFFLLGVDVGLIPIGNKIGSSVTRMRSLFLILLMGFLLGAIITYAEPDVTVLANQVFAVRPSIEPGRLVLAISIGVGLFLSFSLARTILHISLKRILFICYLILIAVAVFQDEFISSIAFDSGGATTGPLSVPFIMAIGMGVAATRKKDIEADFGYVAMASIGPIFAVIILGLLSGNTDAVILNEGLEEGHRWYALLGEKFQSVGMSLSPLLIVCFLMQAFVLKLSKRKFIRILIGILYAYFGLVIFSFGVDFSFSSIAESLGRNLSSISNPVVILIGGLFGACVVLAEPAIWVLTVQVEEVSLGRVSRKMLMIFLSAAVATSLMLSLIRAIYALSIWYFLIPGYAIILLMLIFTPKLFGAIAFDSGGVATGPMASTFLLPFVIGAAGKGSSLSGFGMIALVAMMPVISIELLGLIYSRKKQHVTKEGTEDEK